MSDGVMGASPEFASRPVIIEAAINGARSKAANPHVPLVIG